MVVPVLFCNALPELGFERLDLDNAAANFDIEAGEAGFERLDFAIERLDFDIETGEAGFERLDFDIAADEAGFERLDFTIVLVEVGFDLTENDGVTGENRIKLQVLGLGVVVKEVVRGCGVGGGTSTGLEQ